MFPMVLERRECLLFHFPASLWHWLESYDGIFYIQNGQKPWLMKANMSYALWCRHLQNNPRVKQSPLQTVKQPNERKHLQPGWPLGSHRYLTTFQPSGKYGLRLETDVPAELIGGTRIQVWISVSLPWEWGPSHFHPTPSTWHRPTYFSSPRSCSQLAPCTVLLSWLSGWIYSRGWGSDQTVGSRTVSFELAWPSAWSRTVLPACIRSWLCAQWWHAFWLLVAREKVMVLVYVYTCTHTNTQVTWFNKMKQLGFTVPI